MSPRVLACIVRHWVVLFTKMMEVWKENRPQERQSSIKLVHITFLISKRYKWKSQAVSRTQPLNLELSRVLGIQIGNSYHSYRHMNR